MTTNHHPNCETFDDDIAPCTCDTLVEQDRREAHGAEVRAKLDPDALAYLERRLAKERADDAYLELNAYGEPSSYRLGEYVPTLTLQVIDQLAPREGVVLLIAQGKTGKTTLELNLARCFVTGEAFLGRFDVKALDGVVHFINLEMPKDLFDREAHDARIPDGRMEIHPFAGRYAKFASDLRTDRGIEKRARELRDKGSDGGAIIVDPLSILITGMGLESNASDARRAVDALRTLGASAGAELTIVAHHAGWGDDARSRGSSSIVDAADVIWTLTKEQGEDINDRPRRRYFEAFGRGVDVPQGRLEWDRTTYTLTLPDGAPSRTQDRNGSTDAPTDKQLDHAWKLVHNAPDHRWDRGVADLYKTLKVNSAKGKAILDELESRTTADEFWIERIRRVSVEVTENDGTKKNSTRDVLIAHHTNTLEHTNGHTVSLSTQGKK